jgi:hypothetical protein
MRDSMFWRWAIGVLVLVLVLWSAVVLSGS